MLKDEVANALIIQLNKEFQSSYIYLGMSAYASKKGLAGCANWFLIQYQEELTHAMKLFKYLENHNNGTKDRKFFLNFKKCETMNENIGYNLFYKLFGISRSLI